MKTVTKPIFVADDGTEFFSKEECSHYERKQEVYDIIEDHLVYGNEVGDVSNLADAIVEWYNGLSKKS